VVFIGMLKKMPINSRLLLDISPPHGDILSIFSSVYNPLGFVSLCIPQAQFILQELFDKNPKWDDPIPIEDERLGYHGYKISIN